MEYAPRPTEAQLDRLGEAVGAPVVLGRRLEGGLGCTMDVVQVDGRPAVLRRYGPWYGPEDDPASREWLALERLREAGVVAPSPIWSERLEIFREHAIVISYIDGAPLLKPDDPLDWARQLGETLAAIHALDPTGLPDPHDDIGTAGRPIPERFLGHPLGSDLWEAIHDAEVVPVEPAFLHTDFHPGNVLFREQQLVAVVDWEDPSAGDPMVDVAYCEIDLRYTEEDAVVEAFLDSYFDAAGRESTNLPYWRLRALARPIPDLPAWVGSWNLAGVDITVDEAVARHTALIAHHLSA